MLLIDSSATDFIGTVAFLATSSVWIAINKGGRMAALDKNVQALRVKKARVHFADNCSKCHGTRLVVFWSWTAPALNCALFARLLADIHKQREGDDRAGLGTTTQARKARDQSAGGLWIRRRQHAS